MFFVHAALAEIVSKKKSHNGEWEFYVHYIDCKLLQLVFNEYFVHIPLEHDERKIILLDLLAYKSDD